MPSWHGASEADAAHAAAHDGTMAITSERTRRRVRKRIGLIRVYQCSGRRKAAQICRGATPPIDSKACAKF